MLVQKSNLRKYNRIAEQLKSYLDDFRSSSHVLIEDYRFLRGCYSESRCPTIDYDKYGNAFTYSFLLENYWKGVFTFLQDPPPVASNLLDIGSGSGAFTIAYLAWLDNEVKRNENKWRLKLTLVDRSDKQLIQARELLDSCRFRHIQILPRFVNSDFMLWDNPESEYDLVLLGHVVNENIRRLNTFFPKVERATAPSGKIYIAERLKDHLWKKIDESISHLVLNTSITDIQLEGLTLGESSHLQGRDSISVRSHSLQLPSNKVFAHLIRSYFKAWAEKSIPLLGEIFTENAEYQEKPFEPPISGIGAIKDYWKEKVLPQKNITIKIFKAVYSGNTACVVWRSCFNLPDSQIKAVEGVILFSFDVEAKRINRLEEYFRTHSSFLLPPEFDHQPDELTTRHDRNSLLV
jgi:ubiquinone/menaquinone biosynthesis C-methylase UbiE